MAPIQRLACRWCKAQNDTSATTCSTCGAPLDVADLVSDSGWREAPRLRDMTEFHFGQSSCQVEGEVVPVAEINLGQGDAVFFEHHVMLWKDERVPMSVMPLQGGAKRALAGMPFIVTIAQGAGRIAFSRDQTGEIVVLPLHPGMELDVREHAFLLASHTIAYSYVRIQGLRNILFGGQGMFMDRFVTGEVPGLLLLHGYGNVFERELQAGESVLLEPGNAFVRALQQGETMLIKPTSLLYKDPTVQMQLHFEHPGGTWQSWRSWGNRYLWLRMHGPGRVAVESAAPHFHDPGRNISRMSPATKTQW